MLPAPEYARARPKGGGEDPGHLFSVERLREHVVAAQIQHFRPERVVRYSGGDNQNGRGSCLQHLLEDILPIAIREIRIAYHD